MTTRPLSATRAVALPFIAVLLTAVAAAQTEHWDFDLKTEGENVFWTSPTAVDIDKPEYDGVLTIDLVEIEVSYLGIPFGPFDVTDQIPDEYLKNSDVYYGSPPFVLLNEHVAFPLPPEDPALAADVLIQVDANGYGQASATNVFLGEMEVDLGWPWGTVMVQIESVRLAGWVEVTPRLPGDLNGDNVVDQSDLGILLADWGCVGDDCPGDADGDADTDQSDLGLLLAYWGWGS